MKDLVPALAAVIAGIFAIVSPFITWKLKNASDERARLIALDKERRDEIKRLYTDTYALFEQVMGQVMHAEEFTLAGVFAEANAKIHLLAPPKIAAQYGDACSLLEEWSRLHAKSQPQQMKLGEKTVTFVQSPDPAAKYKEPAKASYDKLQTKLQELTALMRAELRSWNSRA